MNKVRAHVRQCWRIYLGVLIAGLLILSAIAEVHWFSILVWAAASIGLLSLVAAALWSAATSGQRYAMALAMLITIAMMGIFAFTVAPPAVQKAVRFFITVLFTD
ncbi:hypothetical protein C4552_04040 [Candidatus Parcubacteria bacterium]|nr:MAG: hypothetical protein C4552_04040 [Candidatus Parcubacteria bacterium]